MNNIVENSFFAPSGNPPVECFTLTVHYDIRKFNTNYAEKVEDGGFDSQEDEDAFLTCCGNSHSIAPERVRNVYGEETLPWLGNFSAIFPWEMTEKLYSSAVAITAVYPDGRKIVLL